MPEIEKVICFYHNADLDGHCAGAIVKLVIPDAEMIGINYGYDFPWWKIGPETKVIMLDYCLQPFSDMMRLSKQAGEVIWIDHHESNLNAYRNQRAVGTVPIDAYLHIGRGACWLAWEYFQNPNVPTIIKLLSDYDCWNKQSAFGWKKKVLPFHMGFKNRYGMAKTNPAYQPNVLRWKQIFSSDDAKTAIELAVKEGLFYLKKKFDLDADYLSAYAYETAIEGHRAVAVNKGFANSLTFEPIENQGDIEIFSTYVHLGEKFTVSLYSNEEGLNVGKIASVKGGGGHASAAGFQCKELPFYPLAKAKIHHNNPWRTK